MHAPLSLTAKCSLITRFISIILAGRLFTRQRLFSMTSLDIVDNGSRAVSPDPDVRVLVIDDSPKLHEKMKKEFKLYGHLFEPVFIEGQGHILSKKAYEYVKKTTPDVIFMDGVFDDEHPNNDGRKLISKLRNELDFKGLILAHSSKEDMNRGMMNAGADAILPWKGRVDDFFKHVMLYMNEDTEFIRRQAPEKEQR